MKNYKKQKGGILIFLVIAFFLIAAIGIGGLLFVLMTHLRTAEALKERTQAYYLCETGASVAILDIARGAIGTGPGQRLTHTFDREMGGETYQVKYTVSKSAGMWNIVAEVGPPRFNRTYKLRIGGMRSFPIFIRGFGGK
jgi:hypothetical protein